MRNVVSQVAIAGGLVWSLLGCGSGAHGKDSEAPLKVASLKAQPASGQKKAPDRASEGEQPKSEPHAPALQERDAIRKASRPPMDLLAAPNVVFIFNFTESEVGISARERCDEEAADDPQQNRACLAKARSKVAVEFVRFLKDDHGNWWWITYNKYKGNLLKWHKIQFLPGEETPESIVLQLTGKDKGVAPMARVPRTLKVEFPNDYSIVLHSHEHGRMVFDAKIGLLEPDN